MPRASVPAALAVACCLLVAGCAGGPGPGSGTGPPSPSDAREGSLPPGVDADGSVNATALVAAHRARLVADGAALAARTTTRATGPTTLRRAADRNRTTTTRAVAAAGATPTRTRRRVVTAGGCRVVDRWRGDGVGRERVRTASRPRLAGEAAGRAPATEIRRARPADPATVARVDRLAAVLSVGAFDLVAVREGRPTRYVLAATRFDPPAGAAVEADATGVDARVVVDARGRIRTLRATVVRVERNRWGVSRLVRSLTYRLRTVGPAAPPRPAWLGNGTADVTAGDWPFETDATACGGAP